ncbi:MULTISPECIES: hypothetical protein [Haloferax]|uniref:Uncharacterized protein n=2 Tax=Haloferax TaxID=2251 RepID=A0A6G1Z4X4_9EURY|nr:MULTISPECIES: hypothetical protein [Haloferax]KAB1188882.1 hypothetical protein Hfx1149_12885 [Haloferax sp. CBA1149]MRW81600.1 hypothetical protein [Haloferax marinisediminis]
MSPSTRTRREILGLGGSTLALLSGCLSDPPSTSDDADTTDPPTQTTRPTTTEPADVTVSNVQVTPELVGLNSPDSIGTVGDRDEQFVLVTILVDGESSPPVEEFTLATDDQDFSAIPPDDLPAYGRLWSRGYAYGSRGHEDSTASSGYLAFRVPKPLETSEVVFRGPGGQFTFGANVGEKLSRPPTDFAVSDVTAPETVESLSEMSISATIENVGSADGTFVGALNRTGPLVAYTPVERVELELAPGESTTWEQSYTLSLDGGTEPRPVQFHLVWRDGRVSTETTVEAAN